MDRLIDLNPGWLLVGMVAAGAFGGAACAALDLDAGLDRLRDAIREEKP